MDQTDEGRPPSEAVPDLSVGLVEGDGQGDAVGMTHGAHRQELLSVAHVVLLSEKVGRCTYSTITKHKAIYFFFFFYLLKANKL